MLIDTHAHLDDDQFQSDLPAVLQRARAAGVEHIVTIATTAASSEAAVNLAKRIPDMSASVGIQPNHIAQEPADAWDRVLKLAMEPVVRAVGETGLDRHWDHTPFAMQEDYFARHLELGRKFDRAVVIHCRKAEADVVRKLRADFDQHGPLRGVMHSFTGDLITANACLDMGLHLSFAGMLTYKNAQDLRDVAAAIPLERLLVETDSPYLAPVPMRGKRNEPAFVVHTAQTLAELKGITLERLAERTSRTACELFGISRL